MLEFTLDVLSRLAKVVLGPGTGRHRADSEAGRHAAASGASSRRARTEAVAPPFVGTRRGDGPSDVDGVPLVRPYRVAAEQAARRAHCVPVGGAAW